MEPPRQPEHGLPVVAPGEDTNGTGANVAPPEEPGLETLPAVPAQPTLRGGPKINAGVIPLPAPSSLPPPPMKPVAPKEQSTRLSLTREPYPPFALIRSKMVSTRQLTDCFYLASTPDTGSRSTRDASVRKIEKDTTNLLVSKSPKAEAKVIRWHLHHASRVRFLMCLQTGPGGRRSSDFGHFRTVPDTIRCAASVVDIPADL